MYLLLLDETNIIHTEVSQYFLYGGVFFSSDKADVLHKEIEIIRKNAGFKSEDIFKFETNSRPKHVVVEAFNQAKEDLLDLCIKNDVRFIIYIVHHAIARQSHLETKIEWASSEIINVFDDMLGNLKEVGIVIFDGLQGSSLAYLEKKFTKGITTATQTSFFRPQNIVGYSATKIGASHLNSIVDIAIGSFRYCVNSGGGNSTVDKLLPRVKNLLHYRQFRGKNYFQDFGLLLRPHRNVFYGRQYNELMEKLGLDK